MTIRKAKKKPYYNKKQMAKIKSLAKKYGVDIHEAARMYVQSGVV
jgi:archaellum biogenesis protein FlaJ (TadC family)